MQVADISLTILHIVKLIKISPHGPYIIKLLSLVCAIVGGVVLTWDPYSKTLFGTSFPPYFYPDFLLFLRSFGFLLLFPTLLSHSEGTINEVVEPCKSSL